MRRQNVKKDDYIGAIGQKLQKAKKYLMYGPLGEDAAPLRDEQGIMQTFSNVINIGENFYDRTGGVDVVADSIITGGGRLTNFSGESYGNVSLVQTMGAIDVTIMTLANSLIPFLAVDRSMANPVDTIYYANLVSTNAAGGVGINTELMNNFAPPNPNVNLGPAVLTQTVTATGASQTIAFNEYIVASTVQVVITHSAVAYNGQDFAKDGNVYYNGFAAPTTVNYQTGLITIASGLTNGDTIAVTALLDVENDTAGSNILKVRSEHIPTTLTSQPKSFIFEENEHANMYMARIMAQAAKAGGVTDYRDLYFSRLTNMYIEDINRDLIKILVAISATVTPITLDLTTYTASTSFAETKNDLIANFFIKCRSDFISRNNIPCTVCVTSTKGTSLLENHPTKWVAGPNYRTQLNGFVGTFDGVPVYRHNYLDSIRNSATASYYFGAKLPDNSSGTMVFGEFLPLVQTSTIGNVSNPMQKSTGWFSQVGSQAIVNSLVSLGTITFGTY